MRDVISKRSSLKKLLKNVHQKKRKMIPEERSKMEMEKERKW